MTKTMICLSEVHIDFETRSAVSLDNGTAAYFADPSTEVLCCAFTTPGGIKLIIGADLGRYREVIDNIASPEEIEWLFQHVKEGRTVVAHNAGFELDCWNTAWKVLHPHAPELKPEQLLCTMSIGYSLGLPGSLEKMGEAIGISKTKDTEGRKVMLKTCKPDANGNFPMDPDMAQKLCEYCIRDVEAEHEIFMRQMTVFTNPDRHPWYPGRRSRRVYIETMKMNDRGIPLDMELTQTLADLYEEHCYRIGDLMEERYGVSLSDLRSPTALLSWLREQGEPASSIAASAVDGMLSRDDLSHDVRQVLQARQDVSVSSAAKYKKMLGAQVDGRVKHCFQFHGATQTGRWAGRIVQPQNLPRPTLKNPDCAAANVLARDIDRFDLGELMKSLLRHVIKAPEGYEFIASDWSAIEARVIAWLAGDSDAIKNFMAYDQGTGEDIYRIMAGAILGVDPASVDDDGRKLGKVAELGLGFGAGATTLKKNALEQYGVDFDANGIDPQDVVDTYRSVHKPIKNFWYELETAAKTALKTSGAVKVGAITYVNLKKGLACKLPSGRVIWYPQAELREVEGWEEGDTKEQVFFRKVVGRNTISTPTFGSRLAENVTQAVAADLMYDALLRAVDRGMKPVMLVHDEMVIECEKGRFSVEDLNGVMCVLPEWATGLPVSAEGWKAERYKK